MLSVNSNPVPRPCGSVGCRVAHHWAIAFSPIFDSKAEVIHELSLFPLPVPSILRPADSAVKGGFQNDILRSDGFKQFYLAVALVNADKFFVQGDGEGGGSTECAHLFPLSGTDRLFDGVKVKLGKTL